MLGDWHRQIRLPIPFEEWEMLPRFAGYKSEYFDGEAVWSPRPKYYNALLDLSRSTLPIGSGDSLAGNRSRDVKVRPLQKGDWTGLPNVLLSAFIQLSPFCTVPESLRSLAATDCVTRTRNGGDGELLPDASVVACDDDAALVGAILVTRWTHDQEDGPDAIPANPSTDAHMTWAFVQRLDAGHGIGSAMLTEVVATLRKSGFKRLFSTFISGNESSMLWHWRNGFRLLSHPASPRQIRRLLDRSKSE